MSRFHNFHGFYAFAVFTGVGVILSISNKEPPQNQRYVGVRVTVFRVSRFYGRHSFTVSRFSHFHKFHVFTVVTVLLLHVFTVLTVVNVFTVSRFLPVFGSFCRSLTTKRNTSTNALVYVGFFVSRVLQLVLPPSCQQWISCSSVFECYGSFGATMFRLHLFTCFNEIFQSAVEKVQEPSGNTIRKLRIDKEPGMY